MSGILAADAHAVYWGVQGSVSRRRHEGGDPERIAIARDVRGLTVDAANVYWTSIDESTIIHGSAHQAALDGSFEITLATEVQAPRGIAVGGGSAYFTRGGAGGGDPAIPGSPFGAILKVPLGGGPKLPVATSQYDPDSVAADDTHVYWTNTLEGTIMALPFGGGQPVTLAQDQIMPRSLVVDATHVYWAASGAIRKVPLGGGVPEDVAPAQNPRAMVLDGGTLYFIDDYNVLRVPASGGARFAIAVDQREPHGLAVGGGYVYWCIRENVPILVRAPK